MRNFKRFCLTNILVLIFCKVWQWLEIVIDGQITNRKVDNIIMLLFVPVIWIATDKLIEEEKEKENKVKEN